MDVKLFKVLNNKNISEDQEYTKERVSSLLDEMSSEQKNKILELSGEDNLNSFNLIRSKGVITLGKLLILSYVFLVNPYYILGSEDYTKIKKEHIDEVIDNYLKDIGLEKLTCEVGLDSMKLSSTIPKTKLLKFLLTHKGFDISLNEMINIF